jgi:hypothetical protein
VSGGGLNGIIRGQEALNAIHKKDEIIIQPYTLYLIPYTIGFVPQSENSFPTYGH